MEKECVEGVIGGFVDARGEGEVVGKEAVAYGWRSEGAEGVA